jgi:hypothetical protein
MDNRELFEADTPSNYCGRGKPNISYSSKAWNMTCMANRTTVPVVAAIVMRM